MTNLYREYINLKISHFIIAMKRSIIRWCDNAETLKARERDKMIENRKKSEMHVSRSHAFYALDWEDSIIESITRET